MSKAPTMHFNLPNGWDTIFRIEEATNEELGESIEFESYELLPEEDDIISIIYVKRDISGYEHGSALDQLEYLSEQYLGDLDIPASLCPSIDDFIQSCEIGGHDAHYIVLQQPHEASAEIYIALDADNRDIVTISVLLKDWSDGYGEARAFELLRDAIVFDVP